MNYKKAIVRLESVSILSMSKAHTEKKMKGESDADFEARTWREKLHYDKSGEVFIPASMLKNTLSESVKYASEKIPGKGNNTWTKHFEAGVMVQDSMPLGIHKDSVDSDTVFVPSDGVRGGGKRVHRTFPIIEKWSGEAEFFIFDLTITEDVFKRFLEQAGLLIGFGRFRPRNNGSYGRFKIVDFKWEDYRQ